MATANKIPRLIEEGLTRLAELGLEEVYYNILEEKGEELKQHYISTMKERVTNHIQATCDTNSYLNSVEIKVVVDLKGLDDE